MRFLFLVLIVFRYIKYAEGSKQKSEIMKLMHDKLNEYNQYNKDHDVSSAPADGNIMVYCIITAQNSLN